MTEELQLEAAYRAIQARSAEGDDLPGLPDDALAFTPTAIYEKCADRVGMLGEQEAEGVVRFYGFINGLQAGLRLV